MTPFPQKKQRGIALIEAMVAIIVAALGVLAVLAVQLRTLADSSTTVRRAQAIRLIEDLSERLKVHPNALQDLASSKYKSGWKATLTTPDPDCGNAACNAAQLTAYDLVQWKTTVQTVLPAGDANVFLASGEGTNSNRRLLGVMISWRENERSTAGEYKDSIDVTKMKNGTDAGKDTFVSATGSGTDDVTCPTGSTCHLQYISVAARCAPYLLGGATPLYFCS
jgi:type IV pilus assembly protein PilV